MRLISLIVLPVIALGTLSGCSVAAAAGPAASQNRPIEAVSSVALDTSGDLTITEGEPSLVINAPANIIDKLTAEVRDGVLILGVKPDVPMILPTKFTYELRLPSLEHLEMNGSGDVRSTLSASSLDVGISGSGDLDVSSIDASSVTLDISGSADVEFSGSTDDLQVTIDGTGDVQLDALASLNAAVNITGSADVKVAVSSRLRADISGSGSIVYTGNPQVDQSVSGSGEISRS
jgi:hypothetical protein